MKKQFSNIRWLINPFERIAGWQALFLGFAAMALTAVVGKINNIAFDGVLDVHGGASFSFSTSFIMQVVDFSVLFLTMWLAGVYFSKSKIRAIDIAGTMALARTPMLAFVLICFLPIVPDDLFDILRTVIFAFIMTPFLVWMVALMYNAYTVSCHLKGGRAVWSFVGALLVAEIISKFIFILLLSGLFTNMPIFKTSVNHSTENTIVVADSLTIRQKTENVVKFFERGEFEAITGYFDEKMKKALPPNGLKMAWIQINFICGKFEKAGMDGLIETRIDNCDVIEVPFFFKKENRKLRLAFSEDGEIIGLFFLPTN